jgi:hypothetical protein
MDAMPDWHPDAPTDLLELPLEFPLPSQRETDPRNRDGDDEDSAPGVIVIELV